MNLSVVILTYNEVVYIERCIESARRVSDKIYVVDSYSSDRTQELAWNG